MKAIVGEQKVKANNLQYQKCNKYRELPYEQKNVTHSLLYSNLRFAFLYILNHFSIGEIWKFYPDK